MKHANYCYHDTENVFWLFSSGACRTSGFVIGCVTIWSNQKDPNRIRKILAEFNMNVLIPQKVPVSGFRDQRRDFPRKTFQFVKSFGGGAKLKIFSFSSFCHLFGCIQLTI